MYRPPLQRTKNARRAAPTTVLSSPCPHLTIAGSRLGRRVRHHPTLAGNRPDRKVRRHPTAKNLCVASQHSHPGPHPGQLKSNRPNNRFALSAPSPDTHRQLSRPKNPSPPDSEKPPHRTTTLSPRPQLGLPKRNCLHNRFILSAPSPDSTGNRPSKNPPPPDIHRQPPRPKSPLPPNSEKPPRRTTTLSPRPQPCRPKSNRPDNRFTLPMPSPDNRRQPPQRKVRHHPTLAGNRPDRKVRRHPTAKNLRIVPQHSCPYRNSASQKETAYTTVSPSPCPHLTIAGSRPSEKSATTRHSPAIAPTEKFVATRQRKTSVSHHNTLTPAHTPASSKVTAPITVSPSPHPRPTLIDNRPSEKSAVQKNYENSGPEFGL